MRSDERSTDELRRETDEAIQELEDVPWDETSEVVANAAAHAAAKTARQMSRPDSDPPASKPWHRQPVVRVLGALAGVLTSAAALFEALRRLGALK